MKGSKVTVPLMVAAGAFTPHQLSAAFTDAPTPPLIRSKLLPFGAVLPASRLKLMLTITPTPLLTLIPPPPGVAPVPPVAEFPVIATLVKSAVSFKALYQNPPPFPPDVLLLMMEPVSIIRPADVSTPPPSPAALFPEIVLA